ncbi:hypothetical protein YK56LOC_57360 [Caballeronia sp. HLA56]
MYCSRSITIHLLRGVLALLLIGAGMYFLIFSALAVKLFSMVCFVTALFLLKGCPMCWLAGLVEKIAAQKAKPLASS